MKTLTSIHHQTYVFMRSENVSWAQSIYYILNNSRFFTGLLMTWILVAVAIYLIAIYSFFGLGVALQEKSLMVKNLSESNTIVELNLQQQQTAFVRNNQTILESMEKISDMRYVLPTDTAMSRADALNQSN